MDNVSEVVALLRQQAALAAVLHTARALRRSPDTVSVRDITAFGGFN
jgi:hypothetical protein